MSEYNGKRAVIGSKPSALPGYRDGTSYVNPDKSIPLPYGFKKERDTIDLIYELFCRYPYVTVGRIQNYLKTDISDAIQELRRRGHIITETTTKTGTVRYSLVKNR